MKNILNILIKMDTSLYLKVHQGHRVKGLYLFMKYLTHLGSNPFGFFYGGLILALYSSKAYVEVPRLIVSIVVSQIIIHTLKRLISRPRPYAAMTLLTVKRPPDCVYSFPSGHTAIAFTTALGMGVLLPSLTGVFLTIALGVGLSRIILGYHYPGDVLVGGLIAYGVHLLVVV